MTDILQLPQEHIWLDGTIRELMATLKGLWTEGMNEEIVRAQSSWLLSLLDLRYWGHRMVPQAGFAQEKYATQMFLLVNLPGVPVAIRDRYWQWLEDEVLTELSEEGDPSYEQLVQMVKDIIGDAVRRRDEGGLAE